MSQIWISLKDHAHKQLAFEEYLFKEGEIDEPKLMLWTAYPCVVMGRFQNPYQEINLNVLHEENLQLIRRHSGGGTVYHDLGNLNISFFFPKKKMNKKENLNFIISALKDLTANLSVNERNDIRLLHQKIDYKVSGSAFRESRERSLHHCTLLINADLSKLNPVLLPTPASIESKSIASVKSVVKNLNEINPNLSIEKVIELLTGHWEKHYPNSHKFQLNLKDWEGDIEEYLNKYNSMEWTYGESPKFTLSLPSGSKLSVKKGKILDKNSVLDSRPLWELKEDQCLHSFGPEDGPWLSSVLGLGDRS